MRWSYPMVRRVALRLGVYEPLHRQFIRYLLYRQSVGLQVEKDETLVLTHGKRVLRVSNWDAAAIASRAFDNLFDAVVPRSEGEFSVVDFSRPGWHTLAQSKRRFYFHGVAESEDETQTYLSFAQLKPGAVVYDLGACCGSQTVAMAEQVGPTGKVLAYEPDPQSFAAMQENLDEYKAANVVARNQGIWHQTGTLSFHANGTMTSSFVDGHAHGGDIHQISVVSLADSAKEHGISRLDFLKMDIEGAELEVVRRSLDFLDHFKPRLVIEAHCQDGPQRCDEICRLLQTLGYKYEVRKTANLDAFPLICASM